MAGHGFDVIDNDDITIIYSLKRNGIIHTLFAKLGTGVAFNLQWEKQKAILIEDGGTLNLNVAYLTDYVIKAIEKVLDLYQTNPLLKQRIDENHQILAEKQKTNLQNNREFNSTLLRRYPETYQTNLV